KLVAFDKHYNMVMADCEERFTVPHFRIPKDKTAPVAFSLGHPYIGDPPWPAARGFVWRYRKTKQIMLRGSSIVSVAPLI
ncbi:hypothetical protein SARC_11660, partial [Sphaeroforma arctica JP610]